MADFSEDLFFDPGIVIKQEPITLDTTVNISASVPIPGRRITDLSDYRDLQFNINSTQSPPYQDMSSFLGQPQNTPVETTMWGIRGLETETKQEFMHMDEDDIFKVDKADLIQGPTLAELNANDDTFLGDLNFDDLLLPEESMNYINGLSLTQNPMHKLPSPLVHLNNNNLNNNSALLATSCPPAGMGYYRDSIDFIANVAAPNSFNSYTSRANVPSFTPANQPSVNSIAPIKSLSPAANPLSSKHSTLHELLMKQDNYKSSPERNTLGQSVPGPSSPALNSSVARVARSFNSRLSSSAPTHLGLEQIWQRREPRKHLLSTGSLAEAGSTSSLSTGGVLSPEAHDLSHDEQEYDEDSEHYEDFSSDDGDSDDDDDDHSSKGSKKERFFWQYNVQAKGPKGQRLVMKTKMENPHILNEVTDPVFSTECAVRGIKHSGKARKGDGNDLTPNPRKLYNIGKELDKLSRIINDMTPVSELPFNVRPKSRKEKNKLASRACRLKKKAQHEANKIKLHGLETEHKRLINGLSQVKHMLGNKLKENSTEGPEQLYVNLEKIVKSATKTKIAGQTTDYVNKILEKVKSGVSSGGLEDL